MSTTLHIFNPEHDLALAADSANFTAPHAGRQLRSDLGFLPALWAEDGDFVLVSDKEAAQNAYRKIKLKHHPSIQFITPDKLKTLFSNCNGIAISPWGWNIALCDKLWRAGVPKAATPNEEALKEMRMLSNRSLSVDLLQHLKAKSKEWQYGNRITGLSKVCNSYDEVLQFLDHHKDIVVKAPWSSSGRGVRYITHETLDDNAKRWIANTIERQGSIITEVKCRKVHDFAIEFMAKKDSSIAPCGISQFTTERGAYTGNVLETEEEKLQWLHSYIPKDLLDSIINEITNYLSSRIGGAYTGALGVDMMVVANPEMCNDSETSPFLINPCIEINLRRTMGHVALALSSQGHRGAMRINYDGKNYHLTISSL